MNRKGEVALLTILIGSFILGAFSFGAIKVNQLKRETASLQEKLARLSTLGSFTPSGGITYRLQTSAATTDTTLNLTSFKNRSEIALTMARLNTDIGYGTLSPQTSRSEFISFTGITQNSNGTAQLTGVIRGLSDFYPFTASTTLRESHPGQSIFILSDSPQLFEEYTKRRTLEHITSTWEWSSTTPPQYDAVPTNHAAGTHASSTKEFASVALVNAVTTAGAPNATEAVKGLVELATRGEAASSTSLGGTSASIVLQSAYATTTCQDITVSSILVSAIGAGGRLYGGCVDTGYGYNFNSIGESSSTTIVRLTSSFATSTNATTTNFAVSGSFNFGGISYKAPPSITASSSVLTVSTAGELYWDNSDWQKLGETISTTTVSFLSVVNFPARRDLKIVLVTQGQSSAQAILMRFNNDSGNNYGFTNSNDMNDDSTRQSAFDNIQNNYISTTSPAMIIYEVANESGIYKMILGRHMAGFTGAGAAPKYARTSATWNSVNGMQATTTTFSVGAGTFDTGTRITVYGKRD